MKNLGLIGLLAILFFTNAYSSEGWVRVPVKDLQKTDIEGIFEIKSSKEFSRVNLDCLSFIHGMNFYDRDTNDEWELSYSFYLSESGCHQIYQFINDSLEKNLPACVELNILDNSFELSRKEESCQLGS